MWVLTGLIVGSGLIDLLAIARGWNKARYLWKPATMVLVILLSLRGADFTNSSESWLVAGLVLSLVGDVLLVLPSDRFLAGLVAFLAAHLCYIAAFVQQAEGGGLLPAVVLAVFGIGYFLLLRRGVLASGGYGLLVAVVCYISVILLMVWRAWMTGNVWVLAGAILFMISDSILAWNRFIKRSVTGEVAVMATYYTAQGVLASTLFAL
ncbi:lysoplasmalogenase [Tumebacillus permanentifrigoris]|uniref:Putative membrane protein YhhN n=1 Tax=Tumebacillus permanentifrigoris TaxID=378543 RepID=A0A316D8R2_9BACL|nr:lysoplasmalogenase [Tumebacillus permanentifrigoris]PWK13349.1 putative membrane protein YhhN [Tumebacillus permanentifrigoris]